jgi:uncharacterized protein YkwD
MSVLSAPPAPPTARRAPRRGLAVLAVVLLAITASACLPQQEQSFLDRTNALRASEGLRAYKEHGTLTAKAEAWAQHMASTGVLEHSNLSSGLSGLAWRSLGENVGVQPPGNDPWLKMHQMFASSSGHRANLLSTKFTHMGIGVATSGDGRVWVVEVFAQL